MNKAAWRLALESYPCTYCGARPGEPCRSTVTLKQTGTIHQSRVNAAERCRLCGARLESWRVGEGHHLCPKCQLVRDLEVERATKHTRRLE